MRIGGTFGQLTAAGLVFVSLAALPTGGAAPAQGALLPAPLLKPVCQIVVALCDGFQLQRIARSPRRGDAGALREALNALFVGYTAG